MLKETLLAAIIIAIPLLWLRAFVNHSSQYDPDTPAPKNKRDADIAYRQQNVFED